MIRARRAQRERGDGLTRDERKALLSVVKLRLIWCQYCQSRRGSALDHVVPLSRGGSNREGNLILACDECNWAKAHKTVAEWRHGRKVSVRAIARHEVVAERGLGHPRYKVV